LKTRNNILAAALTGLLFTGLVFNTNAQDTTASEQTASADKKLKISEVKPLQFRVSYNKAKSDAVVVRILDADKNVLYAESKRTETGYLKYFDLSTLLDGTYTFEITDGKEKFAQSFDLLTKTSRVVSSLN
jgi:hypothetical protein